MVKIVIPVLKTQEEFHKWCLNQPPENKVMAMLENWDALIGGACLLKPENCSFSTGGQSAFIVFKTDTEEQQRAVSNLQNLYRRGVGNSNLAMPTQSRPGHIMIGPDHGYLTSLLGIVAQNRLLW